MGKVTLRMGEGLGQPACGDGTGIQIRDDKIQELGASLWLRKHDLSVCREERLETGSRSLPDTRKVRGTEKEPSGTPQRPCQDGGCSLEHLRLRHMSLLLLVTHGLGGASEGPLRDKPK